MTQQFSISEEDYLTALIRFGGPARISEMAKSLGIAAPSVTSMTGKLASKGLVEHKSHQPVELTADGRRVAQSLLRRHRLIELFLTEVLDYGWDEVHEEAHRLEHAVSERFLMRVEQMMGEPDRDPHGQPINGSDTDNGTSPLIKLSDLRPGQKRVIVAVNDHDADLLRYLGSLNLYPGTAIEILSVAPFNGPVTLDMGDGPIAIGVEAARHIFVNETSGGKRD